MASAVLGAATAGVTAATGAAKVVGKVGKTAVKGAATLGKGAVTLGKGVTRTVGTLGRGVSSLGRGGGSPVDVLSGVGTSLQQTAAGLPGVAGVGASAFVGGINSCWKPLSPFLMIGWKATNWMIAAFASVSIIYYTWVGLRTLRFTPVVFIAFYFAAAPLQADQQTFIEYLQIVFQQIDELANTIFGPLFNQLIICVTPFCNLYNYIINLIRYNVRLFLNFFRGFVVQDLGDVLEFTFGLDPAVVTDILDFLDITEPPGFNCSFFSPTYLQCVIDQLKQEPVDPTTILGCRGFEAYKSAMSKQYDVPYDVLLKAHEKHGRITTEGVVTEYAIFKQIKSSPKSRERDLNYEEEWDKGNFNSPSETDELKRIRERVAYYADSSNPRLRNISSNFRAYRNVTEYIIDVLEAMCQESIDFFCDLLEVLLSVIYVLYDILWNLLDYLINNGFTNFFEFFNWLANFIIQQILDIPCLDFSGVLEFSASVINCPCSAFANATGHTYVPLDPTDFGNFEASMFTCLDLNCAVDFSLDPPEFSFPLFIQECIMKGIHDYACESDSDCSGSDVCIPVMVIGVDFSGPSVEYIGFCTSTKRRDIYAHIYYERIKAEDVKGATYYGAVNNDSVIYWRNKRNSLNDTDDIDKAMVDTIKNEYNISIQMSAQKWMKDYSPRKDYWRRMVNTLGEEPNTIINNMIGAPNTFKTKEFTNTIKEKSSSLWDAAYTFYSKLGEHIFNQLDEKAARIGVPVHTVTWDTYDINGRMLSRRGVPLKRSPAPVYNDQGGIDEYEETIDDMIAAEEEDGGISGGLTRAQLILRAFTDILKDNMNIVNTIRWDSLDYTFNVPSSTNIGNMFKNMKTMDKYGEAWGHLIDGSKEYNRDNDLYRHAPSGLAQVDASVELILARFMAPQTLGRVAENVKEKGPVFAAAVKRTLPIFTEGHNVDLLMEKILLGQTKIWDYQRYIKVLRKKRMKDIMERPQEYIDSQKTKILHNSELMRMMQYPPVPDHLKIIGETMPEISNIERLPQLAAVIPLLLPFVKNPKIVASVIPAFMTSYWGRTIMFTSLRSLGRPLENIYHEGLIETFTPAEAEAFAEDFGMTTLYNVIFLTTETIRLILCNWWAIVLNFISAAFGWVLNFIPYVGQVAYALLGFFNGVASGASLMAGYCPPHPILVNYIPTQLPWNYLFAIIDCDPDTDCRVSTDCYSNAPCRCSTSAQYASFFWSLDGDYNNEPCEDSFGMPTGKCLCWPNIPCNFVFPQLDLEKPFSHDCASTFGYQKENIVWWQHPSFSGWVYDTTFNWWIGSQFITRSISQGRSHYINDTTAWLISVVVLGIAAVGMRTRWFIAAVLLSLIFVYVWDLWSEVLDRWIVPQMIKAQNKDFTGPIMKFLLTWIRFPNYTPNDVLGDPRSGEMTCWMFNTPTLVLSIAMVEWIILLIFVLWYAGVITGCLQSLSFIGLTVPTNAEKMIEDDNDTAKENRIRNLEGVPPLDITGDYSDFTDSDDYYPTFYEVRPEFIQGVINRNKFKKAV